MATAAIPGFNATIEISTDGGTVYNPVGEMRDVTLQLEMAEIDATSKDSAGWGEIIAGIQRWSVTAEGLFVDGNTGQDALYDALTGRTLVKLRLRPRVASGLDQYVGDAYITGWENAEPLEDAVAVNITARGSGALTKSNQA